MDGNVSISPGPTFRFGARCCTDRDGEVINPTLTPDGILPNREMASSFTPQISDLLIGRPIGHRELTIPGPEGAPDVLVSIFSRTDHVVGGPGIFHTHGGGMIGGDRFIGAADYLDWVESTDAIAVSVEYRLAPENPDPAPIDDCYAGLVWMAAHADELGFDANRLIIAGASAGGGLTAGLALRARDQGGPALIGQVRIYPMLDDRNVTVSSNQIDGIGLWDRTSNFTGWDALLGDLRGTADVSIYALPSAGR